jgi:hypothetical protein
VLAAQLGAALGARQQFEHHVGRKLSGELATVCHGIIPPLGPIVLQLDDGLNSEGHYFGALLF